MTEHNRFAVLAAPDVDMVGEDEMQDNGNPARVVGAGEMGVRRVALSSESDGSGIEEADSQVGPQRSAASPAASSGTDVEMDPGAGQGWVPLATAMVGKPERPPAWYGEDLRLVVGTSVDCRVLPTPLSEQEEQLLLTLWRRIPLNELPEGCAIRTWLDDKQDLPPAADPGGSESPHCVCKDKSTGLLDSLDCWTLIKNARGDPLSNNVLMALRILAYTMTVDQLRMLAGFLLGDDTATWFPHSRWLGIVRELMAGHSLLRVGSHGDLTNLFMLVPEGSTHLMASTAQGHLVAAWEVRSLQPDSHSEFFPMEIVAPSTGQVRNLLPEKVEVECTGLGGHDLGGPIPWHLCIRTDKFKQGIYGPSIACLEGSLSGGFFFLR